MLRLHNTFWGTGPISDMRLQYCVCYQRNYNTSLRKNGETGPDPKFFFFFSPGPTLHPLEKKEDTRSPQGQKREGRTLFFVVQMGLEIKWVTAGVNM